MPSRVAFHIGLHKTGTTFLQRNVFPAMDGVHSYAYYNPLWELFNRNGDEHVIITCERLSGGPFNGEWADQGKTYLRNIGQMFPDAACIVGFRRHDALVRSLYKQYLHEGWAASPDELFHPDESGTIRLEDLHFRKRIEQREQHFAGVFVYTQEELRDNLNGFLKDLREFLGTPTLTAQDISQTKRNVGVRTQKQVRLLRTLNRVNDGLKGIPFVPTLNNRLFRRLDITPRNSLSAAPGKLRHNPVHAPRSDRSIFAHRVCGRLGVCRKALINSSIK